jgi:hypothetical protein
MENKEFVKNFYIENKSLFNCIVDKDFIIKKSKEFFYSGCWKNSNIKHNEIVFGSTNGLCFQENEILILFQKTKSGYGKDEISSLNLSELNKECNKDYNLFLNYFNIIPRGSWEMSLDDYKIKWFLGSNWLTKNLIKINEGTINNYTNENTYRENKPKCILNLDNSEIELLNKFLNSYLKEMEKEFIVRLLNDKKRFQLEEQIFEVKKSSLLNDLDKDNNGEIDLVENESFYKILIKNQKDIIDFDKSYIQKFVKISNYLKSKKINIQNLFISFNKIKNEDELNELYKLLQNQVHTYDLLVFHSLSMISSLIESDLITFYEIYECFDKLGVFNSNWENEVSEKLSNIELNIKELMYSIYHMENSIIDSIENLTYITQDSFNDLNNSINSHLSSIDSSLKFNNLLSTIQTYQVYKINQNTKRIDK